LSRELNDQKRLRLVGYTHAVGRAKVPRRSGKKTRVAVHGQ
jgi:hypothetical protein